MKKIVLLSIILASFYACKKSTSGYQSPDSSKPKPQLSTSLYHQFGGYDFYLAGFDFYTEIVHDFPDPDPLQQAMNEKILYIGIALNDAQCKYQDVNDNILQAVANVGDLGGVTAKAFFDQHLHYELVLDSVLNHYNVASQSFFDPIVMHGYNMEPGIRVPLNAFNQNSHKAIIAMGIEAKPPFHDSREDYAEDYIPAYFPMDQEECSIETVVGYDDDYDDFTLHPLNEQLAQVTHTIAVITQVETDGNGGIVNKTVFNSITVIDDQVSSPNTSQCEPAYQLFTEKAVFRNRWQNLGKSRVRAKYRFMPAQNKIRGESFRYRVRDLDKSYFNSPTIITNLGSIGELHGENNGSFPSGSPINQWGCISIYEHDWYGWPRYREWRSGPVGMISLQMLAMKSPWEFYTENVFAPYYWCRFSYITTGYYNNNSEVTFRGI